MFWLSFLLALGSRIGATYKSRILPKEFRGRQDNLKPLSSEIVLIYLGAGALVGMLYGLLCHIWPSWHGPTNWIWFNALHVAQSAGTQVIEWIQQFNRYLYKQG